MSGFENNFPELIAELEDLRKINSQQKDEIEKLNKLVKSNNEEQDEEINFLKRLLFALPHAIYIIDPFNYTIKFQNNTILIPEPDDKGCLPINSPYMHFYKIEKIIKEKNSISDELLYYDTTKSLHTINVNYFPILNDNNEVSEVAIVLIDVTTQKTREYENEKQVVYLKELIQKKTSELGRAQERALESDRLKTAFLTNLSHELRTPMNAIVGFSSLLGDENLLHNEKNIYINYIEDSAKTLLNLINDILDIAKIEAGEVSLEHTEFFLNRLMVDLFTTFYDSKDKINKAQIELVLKIPDCNSDLLIWSDPNKIQQIMSHLIKNAFKFTERGFVEFGYRQEGDFIEFYVNDTGIGINKDNLKVIFERFRKIEDNRLQMYGGAGVGLTIAKKMVELLGGKIWVESTPLFGSTFYFTIPFHLTENGKKLKSSALIEERKYSWSNKNILVVEDKEISYIYLKEIFEDTGVNLIWAKNGKQAVEICKSNHHIDLILMDIQMPEMNGFEAKKEIKLLRKSVPIIAQSAFTMLNERDNLINAGFDDFIPKFLKSEDILDTVCKYISSISN